MPDVENVRRSYGESDIKISTGIENQNANTTNIDQSDYNYFDIIPNKIEVSKLNQTQNLKLSDYLRLIDSSLTEYETQNKSSITHNEVPNENQEKVDQHNNQWVNVTIESLSAIAKLFSQDFKRNEDSAIDIDEEHINSLNIEEVTEDDASEAVDKRKPQFNIKHSQKQNNNKSLINAINGAVDRIKAEKITSNSVITRTDKNRTNYKQFKRPEMTTLNRKYTIKNRKENEALLIYNDEYRDHNSKKKKTHIGSMKIDSSRKSGKSNKVDEKVGFKKAF